MKYLSQSELKQWRIANKPRRCPILDIEFEDAVVDHDHESGIIRGVIHRQANAWEGKIYNSWRRYAKNNSKLNFIESLEKLVKYLKQPGTNIWHPSGVVQLGKRFGRLKKEKQIFSLKKFGVKKSEINACNNTSDRVKLYKKVLKNL